MFGALRDCVPQLQYAKHEETSDLMTENFKKEIMAILKEVKEIKVLHFFAKQSLV